MATDLLIVASLQCRLFQFAKSEQNGTQPSQGGKTTSTAKKLRVKHNPHGLQEIHKVGNSFEIRSLCSADLILIV